MARTIIGSLLFSFKDNASGPAKASAASLDQSLLKIEAAQKRLAAAPWGAGMQKQLDSLKISGREMQFVQNDWNRLQQSIKDRSLSKALGRAEISNWKTSTVGAFARVRAEATSTHTQVSKLSRGLQGLASFAGKAALVSMGAYTGAYLGGVVGRAGVTSWADNRREIFRQEMAGISPEERRQIMASSLGLTGRYSSVGLTDTMSMARTSRNLMGDTTRGNLILEDMVKAQIILQSSKGISGGASEIQRMQKGMDSLGINAGKGNDPTKDLGVQQIKAVMEGFVRSSQIEGMDLDIGQLWQFARRSKVAGSALSNEFLSTIAPVLMQDMGSDTAGNAIAMGYKAFVIGARDTAAKADIAAQRKLGIRKGPGRGELVDRKLYGENPYAWAKTYLVPALEKAGVDITNDGEVTHAIAKLSRNSNATMLLTRMVTQMEQYEKSIALTQGAMGFDAVDPARLKDPTVAFEGFKNAWGNLAIAVGGEGSVILSFLNGTADAINSVAKTIIENPGLQDAIGTAGLIGGAAATGFAGYSLYQLLAAGPALTGAAVSLEAAAVSLGAAGGGGLVDEVPVKKAGWLAGFLALIKGAAVAGSVGFVADALEGTPGKTFEDQVDNQRKYREGLQRLFGINNDNAPGGDSNYAEFMRARGYIPSGGPPRRLGPRARDLGTSTGEIPIPTSRPDFNEATKEAAQAGQQIKESLSVTAAPQVDTSSLSSALNMARELSNTLAGIGAKADAAAAKAKSSVQSRVNQVYSDSGGGGW